MFFSLGLHVESSPENEILPNTPCVRCRWLESTIRAVCSLWCCSPTWVSQVLVWHHCHHVLANTFFFPRVSNFSIVTTNACCRFRYARAAFTTADGKVAESVRCCPPGILRCFAACLTVSWTFYSPSLSLSCSCLVHAFVCSIFPVFSA